MHFYLTNKGNEEFSNGTILNLASIIKHVMSLASEVEMAALYYGARLQYPSKLHLTIWGTHNL